MARTAISEAAWRLAKTLHGNPQAAAGEPAVLDQADLLPVFGGDEDLFGAALDDKVEKDHVETNQIQGSRDDRDSRDARRR